MTRVAFVCTALFASVLSAESPRPVCVTIQAGVPVRIMRGGIGASWHAIDRELPSHQPKGDDSYSGSAWGGNPDPDDAPAWQRLSAHADWLGLDWVRVELEQHMYEPRRREFSWDNRDMRALYRILDWAQSRHIDVFLQQMWDDVDWNAYPGLENDPVGRLRSAPRSIPEFVYGLGELVAHLTRDKGYTCLRWLSINNEPGWDEFSWWQGSDLKALPIDPAFAAVRAELDSRGIRLPISGPDWTDLPKLDPSKLGFESSLGAFDLHSYTAVFDDMDTKDSYPLREAQLRLGEWAQYAHDRGKPLFLSELGTMGFGWGRRHAGPGSYESGLKDASLVVRGINAGVDGFNRWSFTNRGDLDGQWQLVDTWDPDANRLLPQFRPHPNVYFQFGLLSRFIAAHSAVLDTRVEGPFSERERKLVATALRSPKGNLTVCLVNESPRDADATITLQGLTAATPLYKYAVTRADRDRSDVRIRPLRQFTAQPGSALVHDRIPAQSVTVYSSYRLSPADPGIMSEE
ncbi:MAG: cellulase family glycosylhydrolase [Bryobacteraceae bacterium]